MTIRPGSSARIKVAVFSVDQRSSACAYYRVVCPLTLLAEDVEMLWAVDVDNTPSIREVRPGAIDAADVILVQRFFPLEATRPLLERIVESGKPIVYDTDDWFFEIDPENPTAGLAGQAKRFVLELLSHVAVVTTPTAALAEKMAAFHERVVVAPNFLDMRLWEGGGERKGRDDGVLQIGFAGSPTHVRDLEAIEPALVAFAGKYPEQVRIQLMGCCTPGLESLSCVRVMSHIPTFESYVRRLLRSRWDIGLAPLLETSFNVCKSEVKWLEYAASGACGLFQDLAPYASVVRSGENGLLLGGDPLEWEAALEELIHDPALRERMAAQARRDVLGRHTLQDNIPVFKQLYTHLANRS